MQTQKSQQLFERAQKFIPGGVNSPVRAFKSVGGTPIFINKAKGAYLYDEDGNHYVDFINSWGPMILGHAHEHIEEVVDKAVKNSLSFGTPTAMEVEMAELITQMMPSIEKVRMVNSGTEATMSAVRLARGYTGKDKIIKFEGCYHGHGDSFLIAAGSGAATLGEPNSPGVTKGTAADTLSVPYNDIHAIDEIINHHRGEVAAMILEPVAGNMGCIVPDKDYLEHLRKVCTEENILLIFDEVMTGFRTSQGGVQEYMGVRPDLTTLGKIIGGGMPVGAYGGSKEIMDFVSPVGPVYQAGTLAGNPVAMAAGHAMLSYLKDHPEVYGQINEVTNKMIAGIKENMDKLGQSFTINGVGSMFSIFFTEEEVVDFKSAQKADTKMFATYFREMLNAGFYIAPSQYEAVFVSTAITTDIVEEFLKANYKALEKVLS